MKNKNKTPKISKSTLFTYMSSANSGPKRTTDPTTSTITTSTVTGGIFGKVKA